MSSPHNADDSTTLESAVTSNHDSHTKESHDGAVDSAVNDVVTEPTNDDNRSNGNSHHEHPNNKRQREHQEEEEAMEHKQTRKQSHERNEHQLTTTATTNDTVPSSTRHYASDTVSTDVPASAESYTSAAPASAFNTVGLTVIKPVPSHPMPAAKASIPESGPIYSHAPTAPASYSSQPTAAAPSILTPFNNPSLNFTWPVFSPQPAAPAAPAIQEIPAVMLSPTAPYTPNAPPVLATTQPPTPSHSMPPRGSPQLQSMHSTPVHSHAHSYGSPPPIPPSSYGSVAPGSFTSPPPIMPHLTPEQQQYLHAGWQQAQYFQQLAIQAQQQQGTSYAYATPPPAAQAAAYGSAPHYDSYGHPLPPPSLIHSHSQPNSQHHPSASAPPVSRWIPNSSASALTSPSSAVGNGPLPTGSLRPPAFLPISPSVNPVSQPSSTGSRSSLTGPASSGAPAGLMVLTPRLPLSALPPSGGKHMSNSKHTMKGKQKRKKGGKHRDSSSDDSSSSNDESSSSSSESDGASTKRGGKNSLAPPSLHVRSTTDPSAGSNIPSPVRAQKGHKPSSSSTTTASGLEGSTTRSSSTGNFHDFSVTSPLATPGAVPTNQKPSWKIISPAAQERARLKAEVIARERESLASNRSLERGREERSQLTTPTTKGSTLSLSELTRRSPSSRRSSSANSSSNTPTKRRGSKASASNSTSPTDANNPPTSSSSTSAGGKKRNAVVGAFANPNSDLEIALFLTIIFVAVGAFSVFLLLG